MKVSIILPVYNDSIYLKCTVNSILNQSYSNIELIIINDDSIDGLDNYVMSLNDNRVIYISNNNTSISNALNIGLKKCSGDYITWSSQYNVYHKNAILKMVSILNKKNNCDFIYTSYSVKDLETNKIINTYNAKSIIPIDFLFNSPKLYCFLWRKNILNIIGYLDTELFGIQDFDYWLRILYHNNKFLAFNENLLTHCVSKNNSINKIKTITEDYDLECKLIEKLLNRNNNLLNISQLYPMVPECKNRKQAKSIAYYDLAMKIRNLNKKSFRDVLIKDYEKYFRLSYENNPNFESAIVNFIIVMKMKKMDYSSYLNKINLNRYKINIDTCTFIDIDVSKEDVLRKNIYYLRRMQITDDKILVNLTNDIQTNILQDTNIQINNPSINNIYDKIYTTNKKAFIYYSKSSWDILFQRSHQICKFFDKSYLKVFICSENNMCKYEEKHNLLILSYSLKNTLFENIKNYQKNIIYYTDTELFDDVNELKINNNYRILFDLINIPTTDNLNKCINHSDWVIYSHPELVNFLTDINPEKQYFYVSNGCDYDYFSKSKERIYPKPIFIPDTNKPILGYYGVFSDILDYDLIKKYADEGKYHLVMIGGLPHIPKYNIKFDHPNITWIEYKPYNEIVTYLSWFDVCFLPYRDCNETKYIYPCKIFEYNASEKEIIYHGIKKPNNIDMNFNTICDIINKIITNNKISILDNFNIKQLITTHSLKHLHDRFKKQYKLIDYQDNNINTIYFGVYSLIDLSNIKKLRNKYIIFGGSDVDIIMNNPKMKKIFDDIDNKIIFSISDNIKQRLLKYNYETIDFDLNLVDNTVFTRIEKPGDSIYIYNGISKGKEHVYGSDIYKQIITQLPNYNYIFSNEIHSSWENMQNIYEKCFIGLRLTHNDGNANTVQEFQTVGLPIVHNLSEYGLKWNNVNDVVKHIQKYGNNVLINSHSNLNNTAGDTIWLSNLVNNLIKDKCFVTVITDTKIVNDNFTRNIENHNYFEIIYNNDIVKYIDDNHNKYKKIIIRNHEILHKINNKDWLSKTTLYGLEIHLENIKKIDGYEKIWCQTEKLKKIYIDNGIDEKKIDIMHIVGYKYNFELPPKNNTTKKLIYCGTIRDEENIIEIINDFKKLKKNKPEFELTICYGKICGNKLFSEKINNLINEHKDIINFKYNLSHRDSCYEIAMSDYGICWRKPGYGNNGMEESTKVKEYELYGLTIINSSITEYFKPNNKIVINFSDNLNEQTEETNILTNFANNYAKNGFNVDILTNIEITNNYVMQNIEYNDKINFVYSNDLIKYLNETNYEKIIIYNNELLNKINNKKWIDKVYICGFETNIDLIKNLDYSYNKILLHDDKLKQIYLDNHINEDKIEITDYYLWKYDFNLPERNDNEIRLIYCGTLRDEENILEIIEEFQKIHQEHPEVLLKIVYSKIMGNNEFVDKVNQYIKEGIDGCEFKYNLSHRDACYEIATSDIGICWRKNGWGYNGEVSTKVKEYEMYGLEIINKINKINIINNTYKNKIINNIYINEYFKIAVVKDFEINILKIQKELENIYNFVDFLVVIYRDKKTISNNFKYFKAIEINICEFGEIPNTIKICKYFKNSTIFPIHINYIDLYDKLYFEKSKNNINNICKNFYYVKNYKLVNYFLSNFTINTIPENILLDLCVTDEIIIDFELSRVDFYYEEKYINVPILDLKRKEDYVDFLNDHNNKNQHIVINLNKSIDRKLHAIQSFKKIGINPTFYTPIDFDYIKDHYTIITKIPFKFQKRKIFGYEYPSNCFDIFKICYQINKNQKIITQGAFSYLYTYKEILKYAIKNRLKNLFIYDDDVAFHHNYNISEELLNTNNGIISLGTMDYSWEKNIKLCTNKLYNCKGTSYGSHALIINKNVFHKLLYVLENKILPVDCSPLHLFKYNFDSKIMYPNMAIQRIFKSNISSSNVQYDIQSKAQECLKKYGWNMEDYFFPTIKTILIYDEKMSEEIKSIFNSWEINIDFQYIKDKFIYNINNYDYIFLYMNKNTIQENKNFIKENTIIIEKEFLYNKDNNLTYYTCDSLLKSNKFENKYRCIAVLATFMKRFHVVKKVINNMLPQVDKIYIYANDYSEKNKQDLLEIVNSKEKVEILLGNDHDGDIKDNGKLYLIDNIVKKINHDYIIVIDDDLNYPSDYVEKHIHGCLKYNNNIVSCIHGGLYSNIIYDFFSDRYMYHYRTNIKENKVVTYSGTGTICIPCKFTKFINYEKTMHTGMVDIYFMNNMNFFDIKRICIAREKWGWLREFSDEIGETLYDSYKNNYNTQLQIIEKSERLLLIANNLNTVKKQYSYIIAIKTTINRIKYLNQCIHSIIKNVNLKDVLIIVTLNSEIKNFFDYNIENIVYITSKIKGAAYQNNKAIKYIKDNNIKYKNIFFIDDDVTVSKDIFSYTIENNELNKHICSFVSISTSQKNVLKQSNNPNYEEVDINFVQGAFMNVSSEIIEKVGFFDYYNFPIRSEFHKDYTIRCSRCNFCDKNTISCLKEVNKHINLQNNLDETYIPSIEWKDYRLIKNPKEQKRRELVINNTNRKYIGIHNYNIVSIKNSFNFTNYHFEQDIDNSMEYIIKYLDNNKQNTLFIYGISASELYLKNYEKIINDFKKHVIYKYLNTKLFFYVINESEINFPFSYLNDNIFIFIETIEQWNTSKILNRIQEIFI